MQYDVRSITVAESPTAVVAASTTWERFPAEWKGMLDEVWAFLRDHDLRTAAGHNVMLYRDDVPNVEVGVEVTGPFAPAGRVIPSTLPAGAVATTVHRGSYDGLAAAHEAVRDWCAAHDLRVAGPRWEVYGHIRDDSPVETDVFWLLA
jgi:effector-binding domain-containing protein